MGHKEDVDVDNVDNAYDDNDADDENNVDGSDDYSTPVEYFVNVRQ